MNIFLERDRQKLAPFPPPVSKVIRAFRFQTGKTHLVAKKGERKGADFFCTVNGQEKKEVLPESWEERPTPAVL